MGFQSFLKGFLWLNNMILLMLGAAVARVVTAHIVPGGFHALSRTRPVSAVGAGTLTSPKDPSVVRARVRRVRVLNQASFKNRRSNADRIGRSI